jgi:hypothetical protein
MNCIVRFCCGLVGGLLLFGRFRMHNIFDLSLALHWHLLEWVLQLQGNNQLGTIFSCGFLLNFLAFISVKHPQLVFDIRSFLVFIVLILWCTALLCLLMQGLWMCGFAQHNKMCLHVFGSIMWHNE